MDRTTAILGRKGFTALVCAASGGWTEIVKLLLDCGADVDKTNVDAFTPLFVASQKCHLEVVTCLVEVGKAEVDKGEDNGMTPLKVACQKGHFEVAMYLMNVTEKGGGLRRGEKEMKGGEEHEVVCVVKKPSGFFSTCSPLLKSRRTLESEVISSSSRHSPSSPPLVASPLPLWQALVGSYVHHDWPPKKVWCDVADEVLEDPEFPGHHFNAELILTSSPAQPGLSVNVVQCEGH